MPEDQPPPSVEKIDAEIEKPLEAPIDRKILDGIFIRLSALENMAEKNVVEVNISWTQAIKFWLASAVAWLIIFIIALLLLGFSLSSILGPRRLF